MFKLKTPCVQCPFRTDVHPFLTKARVQEIVDSLTKEDAPFQCHKTLDFDDDGNPSQGDKPQQCAGAMILLQKLGKPNQIMRIGRRLKHFDPEALDMEAPVFDTAEEMVAVQPNR